MEYVQERVAVNDGSYVTDIRRTAFRLGLFYWASEFVISNTLFQILGLTQINSIIAKLILSLFSLLITFSITFVLFRLRNANLAVKIFACFSLAIVGGAMHSVCDHLVYVVSAWPEVAKFNFTDFGYTLVYDMSLFFGWSCLFISILYAYEMRENERLLAASREEALSAQMRALRYQVNPHFLFNTLNSIAGLIEEGATKSAGRMVLSLSSFLRTTLEIDPMNDVRLGEELALQAEYLNIEGERFSDRMKVRIDVAAELEDALVPNLILQPLIENAIKHGVGTTPGMVEITISATSSGQVLYLTVENDSAKSSMAGPAKIQGMGIGLANVAHRLETRFPGIGSCNAGHDETGRFRALLSMPLRL
ncbi:histidine kinase [Phyllobacterium sp. P30BS-XVII]|uniref:sensor histidine kinase n=1 Tax=Phyllobacterium sp. P30BS-XVII TaxID=2587046 RepID=UPI000DD95F81|nr:histidine kinase [Phyllobacterium sp. P30BS-XVII]MBA8899480.1 two-component sensor histidine kinase [Phyllobacterium sp. P30BS-XVII]